MSTPTKEDLYDYRRRHFKVEVRPADHSDAPGEITLSITTNGSQWQSMCFTPEERLKVIRALIMSEEAI